VFNHRIHGKVCEVNRHTALFYRVMSGMITYRAGPEKMGKHYGSSCVYYLIVYIYIYIRLRVTPLALIKPAYERHPSTTMRIIYYIVRRVRPYTNRCLVGEYRKAEFKR